jgi:hypothetical protein
MTNQKPWEADARLDEAALSIVGKLQLSIRREVADRQQPEKGDSTYGLGCCSYERFIFTITQLAKAKVYPWLSMIRAGREFAFAINGCPIRPYRGDSERPPAKQLERAREQLLLFQKLADSDPSWMWFLVVETDVHGIGIQVVVMQANDDSDIRHRCIVARAADLLSDSGPATPVIPISATTTDAPEPIVEPLSSSESEKTSK